jgi:hypothetical protein
MGESIKQNVKVGKAKGSKGNAEKDSGEDIEGVF